MAPGLQGSVELFAHEDENPTRFARHWGMEVLLAEIYSPITNRVAIDGSQVKLASLQAG